MIIIYILVVLLVCCGIGTAMNKAQEIKYNKMRNDEVMRKNFDKNNK